MAGVDKPSDRPLSVSQDSGKPTIAASQQAKNAQLQAQTQTSQSQLQNQASNPSMTSQPPPSTRAHARTTTTSSTLSPSSPSTTPSTIPAPEPSYIDALRTLRPSDLTTVHQKPCARESLLTGIGAGFGVGGLRFILLRGPFQARQYRAMSWAVGAFVLTSAGAHAFCQRRRALEKAAMARANAIIEEKRRTKREEAERKRIHKLEKEEREGGLWKWVGWR